jgi:hypothetical protein
MHKYGAVLAVFGSAILLTTAASAQPGASQAAAVSSNASSPATPATPYYQLDSGTLADVYRVNYFENANVNFTFPSDQVHIVNPGSNATTTNGTHDASPNLCVDIYVLTPDEELNECCGCEITANQYLEVDVDPYLVGNPNNGNYANSGTVKIISSSLAASTAPNLQDSNCDPGAPHPKGTLREWMTHYDAVSFFGSPTPILTGNETPFEPAPLSLAEQNSLAWRCANIEAEDSGNGICTCPTAESTNVRAKTHLAKLGAKVK